MPERRGGKRQPRSRRVVWSRGQTFHLGERDISLRLRRIWNSTWVRVTHTGARHARRGDSHQELLLDGDRRAARGDRVGSNPSQTRLSSTDRGYCVDRRSAGATAQSIHYSGRGSGRPFSGWRSHRNHTHDPTGQTPSHGKVRSMSTNPKNSCKRKCRGAGTAGPRHGRPASNARTRP